MADLHYDAAQIAARFDKMIVLEGTVNSGKTRTLSFVCAKLIEAGWRRIYSITDHGEYSLNSVRDANKKISDRGLVFERGGKYIFVLTAGDKLYPRYPSEWYAFTYAMSDIFLRSHDELKDIKIDLVICPCRSLNRTNSVKWEIDRNYSEKIVGRFHTQRTAKNRWIQDRERLADEIVEKIEEELN